MLKLGDRVRYVGGTKFLNGEPGRIVSAATNACWWVDFDKDQHSGHDAGGKGRPGHCYVVYHNDLEPIVASSPLEAMVQSYIDSELHHA